VTQIRLIAEQFAPDFRDLHLQAKEHELQFHDCIVPDQ